MKGKSFSVSDSSWPHGLQPTRLLHAWDFPGKGTGVGCHCLLWNQHDYIQGKAKCILLEHYTEEYVTFHVFCSRFWKPAAVSGFSGARLFFLRALEASVVQKLQPWKLLCRTDALFKLKGSLFLTNLPWHNMLKCSSICHGCLLRSESCYWLFFNYWDISIWPVHVVDISKDVFWAVEYGL